MKYWPLCLLMSAFPLYALERPGGATNPSKQVEETLDGFHRAASQAKFDAYFAYFAKDSVFIGTDAGERWTVAQFKAYVQPHFAKGKGWTYTARERYISFNTQQDLAWFDEILDSESYGTSRGTGVLTKDSGSWKIAQYHLTFPIPNDLAKKFTDEIKAFEKGQKKR